MQNNKGFTLVELIVVIAVLAIIMLIALPNFSGIQYRMKVRADMTTAGLLGRAVRIWYTDYTTDSALYNKLKIEQNESGYADYSDAADNNFFNKETWVKYEELTGIDEYTDREFSPISLINPDTNKPKKYQFYVVRITSAENGRKISIGITGGDTEDAYEEVPISEVVTYDGTKPAIVYIEP